MRQNLHLSLCAAVVVQVHLRSIQEGRRVYKRAKGKQSHAQSAKSASSRVMLAPTQKGACELPLIFVRALRTRSGGEQWQQTKQRICFAD
eukprot:3603881-Pleurochrysis_carterae.AAC.1